MDKTVLILAMHGAVPKDFPEGARAEFFGLLARRRRAAPEERAGIDRRLAELDRRMRAWPRTPENDPFHAASHRMAEALRETSGCEVEVAFNEFCAPTLEETFAAAVARGASRIVVSTPMLTRGGEHAEEEIPEVIEAARARHPGVSFEYAWPFDDAAIAGFLWKRVGSLVGNGNQNGN